MSRAVGDCACRRTNVHEGDDSLQLVVSGPVEEIAEGDGACGFSGEVRGQPESRASVDTNDWVQFPTAILNIRASDREVGPIHSGDCDKQNAVLPVEELVRLVGGLWLWCN